MTPFSSAGQQCPHCGEFLTRDALYEKNCGHCGKELPAPKAPWHFKLLVAAVILYLGWRLIQLIVWIFR